MFEPALKSPWWWWWWWCRDSLLRLLERAFTMAFIVWQSDSRFSRSETRCGFLPILFRLETERGDKDQVYDCIVT